MSKDTNPKKKEGWKSSLYIIWNHIFLLPGWYQAIVTIQLQPVMVYSLHYCSMYLRLGRWSLVYESVKSKQQKCKNNDIQHWNLMQNCKPLGLRKICLRSVYITIVFYKQALRKQYSQQIHYMVSLEKQNQLMYLSFQVCK
jgi:hypothetical protein